MTYSVVLPRIGTFVAWREAARALASHRISPDDVVWSMEGDDADLFAQTSELPPPSASSEALRVPRAFVDLAKTVVWHSDPTRFGRLYAVLRRVLDAPNLLSDRTSHDVASLRELEKSVRRCQHKMKAFVRFREVPGTSAHRRRFVAWFEPTHHTVEPTAAFFQKRFGDMDWGIVTADVSVRCDQGHLRFSLDQPHPRLPCDAQEALWLTYYTNIFNPARLKVRAMVSEMPKKYWRNLPEAQAIPDLIADAEARALGMRNAQATPHSKTARALRRQANMDG